MSKGQRLLHSMYSVLLFIPIRFQPLNHTVPTRCLYSLAIIIIERLAAPFLWLRAIRSSGTSLAGRESSPFTLHWAHVLLKLRRMGNRLTSPCPYFFYCRRTLKVVAAGADIPLVIPQTSCLAASDLGAAVALPSGCCLCRVSIELCEMILYFVTTSRRQYPNPSGMSLIIELLRRCLIPYQVAGV